MRQSRVPVFGFAVVIALCLIGMFSAAQASPIVPLSVIGPSSVATGQPITFTLSADLRRPGIAFAVVSYSVDFGDGSGLQNFGAFTVPADLRSFDISHLFPTSVEGQTLTAQFGLVAQFFFADLSTEGPPVAASTSFDIHVAPIPSSVLMLATALGLLAAFAWRRGGRPVAMQEIRG